MPSFNRLTCGMLPNPPIPTAQAADRILLITEARQSGNPALRLPASPRAAGGGGQNEFDAAAAVRREGAVGLELGRASCSSGMALGVSALVALSAMLPALLTSGVAVDQTHAQISTCRPHGRT